MSTDAAMDSLAPTTGPGGAPSGQERAAPPSPLDAPPPRQRGASAVAGAGAALAHAAIVLFAVAGAGVAREVSASLAVTEMVNVELPAPPEQEKAPEPPEPPPAPPVRIASQPKPPKPAEEPPAAAAAGQVLTASDEVADFGDTFVSGSGASNPGGVTDSGGTSITVVRDVSARAAGPPRPAAVAPRPDRSRAPQLAGGMRWDCPFPPEADFEDVDHAVVTLRIELSATGEVRAARATTDPGFGFARVARRCAMSKRWSAGVDRDGNAVAGTTVVNVRFDR